LKRLCYDARSGKHQIIKIDIQEVEWEGMDWIYLT